jgi:hypothetical protein
MVPILATRSREGLLSTRHAVDLPLTVALLILAVFPHAAATDMRVACGDSDSIQLETNLQRVAFQVNNDVWGDPHNYHIQCVFAGVGGLGWRWLKPNFSYQPYFPNLTFNVSRNMPTTVAQLGKLQVTFSARVRATGTYNLAFDIWFSSDQSGNHITDEVMVWLLWTNRTINLPTVVNDGFSNYGYITFNLQWRFHAFFLLANRIPFSVDLKKLFNFAEVHGYLRTISLGNEVFSGSGETIIYAINIEINGLSVRNAGGCYELSCAAGVTSSWHEPLSSANS